MDKPEDKSIDSVVLTALRLEGLKAGASEGI